MVKVKYVCWKQRIWSFSCFYGGGETSWSFWRPGTNLSFSGLTVNCQQKRRWSTEWWRGNCSIEIQLQICAMQMFKCDSQQHQPYLNWTPPISCRLCKIWHVHWYEASPPVKLKHFKHVMCWKGWRTRLIPKYEHNTDDAAACLHVILPGLKGGSEFITCANTWLQVTRQHISRKSQSVCGHWTRHVELCALLMLIPQQNFWLPSAFYKLTVFLSSNS